MATREAVEPVVVFESPGERPVGQSWLHVSSLYTGGTLPSVGVGLLSCEMEARKGLTTLLSRVWHSVVLATCRVLPHANTEGAKWSDEGCAALGELVLGRCDMSLVGTLGDDKRHVEKMGAGV